MTGSVEIGLWIAIAVIAVLIIAALVVGLVRYRRRRVSLSSTDTATPVDRSGGYTASSNITFSQSAPAEPVERIDTSGLPAVGDDATIPRDAPKRAISDVRLPEPPVVEEVEEAPELLEVLEVPAQPAPPAEPAAPALDEIAPAEGRLEKLRGRLAKSQNTLGRSMLGLLGGGDLDENSWQDVEDTLLIADLGPVATESVVAA
ncbi:MAG: signal recognition particle-docking protein FtsY, partial [Mycobacterium sp.]